MKMGNSKKLTEGDEINGLNVVVVEGLVKQEPTLRELGDGEYVREFTVGTYIDGRQAQRHLLASYKLFRGGKRSSTRVATTNLTARSFSVLPGVGRIVRSRSGRFCAAWRRSKEPLGSHM